MVSIQLLRSKLKIYLPVVIAIVFLILVILPLAQLTRAAGHANSSATYSTTSTASVSQTVSISPSVVAEIYGGGNYNDAVRGVPFTISSGDIATTNPIDTTQVVVEASQCDREAQSPPDYRIRRAFIEYDTSAITQSVISARLVFTNSQPFDNSDGSGNAVHDLNVHSGTWNSSAQINTMFVASHTFQAWLPNPAAIVGFKTVSSYPYQVSEEIDASAVVPGGTTRFVFRTSSESTVGPEPDTCESTGSGPNGIGNEFTAPLLEITFSNSETQHHVHLPIVLK